MTTKMSRIARVASIVLSAFWAVPIASRLLGRLVFEVVQYFNQGVSIRPFLIVFNGPVYVFPIVLGVLVGLWAANKWRTFVDCLVGWLLTLLHLVVWLVILKPESVLQDSVFNRLLFAFTHSSRANVNAVMPFYIATSILGAAFLYLKSRTKEIHSREAEK